MKKITNSFIKKIFKPRLSSSHKGDHGHALLIAGNMGKMGAAVISSRACLRSGAGLVTVNVPAAQMFILQIAIPEAMCMVREKEEIDWELFDAVGIGPGLGQDADTVKFITQLLPKLKQPLVVDADALNIIASNKKLLKQLPKNTIITPHPKEFDRLFGAHDSIGQRRDTAIQMAVQYQLVIVLKGHETLVTFNGKAFLNTTGNAGLAKGGSGDALAGMITAFLCQHYGSAEAALLGVYLHGLAADITLKNQSMESMVITDVIENIGKAFDKIST